MTIMVLCIQLERLLVMILVPARDVRLIDSINLLISVVFTVNLPIPLPV